MWTLLDRATFGGSLDIGSMAKYPKAIMKRDTIKIFLSSTLKIDKDIITRIIQRERRERRGGGAYFFAIILAMI